MAKKKTLDVQKFEGNTDLGSVKMTEPGLVEDKAYNYDLSNVAVESKTNLEQDEGYGQATVIRCFEFGINPEAFQQHMPTEQELFNYHHKGIEVMLWRDGLAIIPEINPRLAINKAKGTYSIFVTAKPARGHMLNERPQTLKDIAHG